MTFGIDPDPTATPAFLAVLLQNSGKGFVFHDGDPLASRPDGFASIEWLGTVEPTNAQENDTWVDVS